MQSSFLRDKEPEIYGINVRQESTKDNYYFDHLTVKASKGNNPRRCGGLGDILAGTMAVFQHWCTLISPGNTTNIQLGLEACKASCLLVRLASLRTYREKGRGMTAPDVVETLSRIIQDIEFEEVEDVMGDEEEGID